MTSRCSVAGSACLKPLNEQSSSTDALMDDKLRLSVSLKPELVDRIDCLRQEWGVRSRSAVLERLLEEVLDSEESDDE